MTSSPLNLHVHGVHVSPKGNADNVMLHIPAGMSNTYTYRIPKNMPQGAYWYHSHLHGLTTPHVYYGLAGLLAIGRTDGNLPLVTQHDIPDPQHGAAVQLRCSIGQAVWRSSTIPIGRNGSARSSRRKATSWRRARTGRCSRRSISLQSKKGTQVASPSGIAGPLSIRELPRAIRVHPEQSAALHAPSRRPRRGRRRPIPSLPDYKRDVQFTVNGLFQPVIKSKAGQTEIWVLANVSDIAYMTCSSPRRRRATTPRSPSSARTASPSPAVHYPVFEDGTRLLIPPATRYAIAVTMPAEGDLMLEMPPRGGGATTISSPGILYTNDGTENPPATLGSLSVLPSAVSYFDGFFVFPTQVLARAATVRRQGRHHCVQRGAEARCLQRRSRTFRRFTPDVERGADDLRRLSQRSCQPVRSESLRLRVRGHGISQCSPAPAAARLGGGMDIHQQQQ